MHPFFSRPAQLLSYIGSWLGLSVLASFAVSYPDGSFILVARSIIPSGLLFSFLSMSAWNLCKAYPIRGTNPVVLVIMILSSSMLIGSGLGACIAGARYFFGDSTPLESWTRSAVPLLIFVTGTVLYLLSVIFHYLLIAYQESRAAERRSLEAEIHARSSELKALRAQIDPHFLFNSLNSIAALINADPARARMMTVQLADFFRASVAAGRQHVVPLEEEIRLVRMYLEIEAVRFGKRLNLEIDAPGASSPVRVPPLILQPLVENAIKHGIAHLVDGGTIRILIRQSGEVLSVAVRNPVEPDTASTQTPGTRFGLEAIRDRLKALAPGRAFLDTNSSDGTFEAIITLPTDLA